MFINGTVAPVNFLISFWRVGNLSTPPFSLQLAVETARGTDSFFRGTDAELRPRRQGPFTEGPGGGCSHSQTRARSQLSLQPGLVSVADGKKTFFKNSAGNLDL